MATSLLLRPRLCVHLWCLTGDCGLDRAHWYLAVICFPGLEQPVLEQNPLCSGLVPQLSTEEAVPDHCRPLSPDRDGMDEEPSPTGEQSNGDVTKEDATLPEGGQEAPQAEPRYTSESLSQGPQWGVSPGDTSCEAFSTASQVSCTESASATVQGRKTTTPSPSPTTRAPVR